VEKKRISFQTKNNYNDKGQKEDPGHSLPEKSRYYAGNRIEACAIAKQKLTLALK
jgi:hypothetical protein